MNVVVVISACFLNINPNTKLTIANVFQESYNKTPLNAPQKLDNVAVPNF